MIQPTFPKKPALSFLDFLKCIAVSSLKTKTVMVT